MRGNHALVMFICRSVRRRQCHSKFDKLFNNYKIKYTNHSNYMQQFFRAVMHFNAYHV